MGSSRRVLPFLPRGPRACRRRVPTDRPWPACGAAAAAAPAPVRAGLVGCLVKPAANGPNPTHGPNRTQLKKVRGPLSLAPLG